MFTINQIKEVQSRVKSGADFPKAVQELIGLGVLGYENYVSDGHTVYEGKDGFHLNSLPKYAAMEVAEKSDIEKFKHYLKIHQQGETDYPTFCTHSAETGVEKWRVDIGEMTCVYFDRSGGMMLLERIPVV